VQIIQVKNKAKLGDNIIAIEEQYPDEKGSEGNRIFIFQKGGNFIHNIIIFDCTKVRHKR